MRFRTYKTPATVTVHVKRLGGSVTLSVVSPLVVDEAHQMAGDRFRSLGEPPEGESFDVEVVVQTLARALVPVADPIRVRETFYLDELFKLYEIWEHEQAFDIPDTAELTKSMMRRLFREDFDILIDGGRATHCESVADFYGKPVAHLTNGQIGYYQCLKNAWNNTRGSDDGSVKYVSEKWLNSTTN